jgi:putative two-component system response regulator
MNAYDIAGATILIVDDEPASRELLARCLQRDGYRVESAADGESAVAAMAECRPDLVLLDVMLPGLDGFDVCRRIKAEPATRLTPVVMLTALDAHARLQGITAGADDFLSKPFDANELSARVASLVRLKRYTDELDTAESVILSLALTVEARDPYTGGHCQRLSAYSVSLGQRLGLRGDALSALRRGGYLHDVGKIGVPDALLLKTSALSPREYQQIQQHTIIGDRLCGDLRSLRAVRPIIRHHHERLDGSGYPDGLAGDHIPITAQIVAIADTYDAITTSRPYRAAMPASHAFDELAREVTRGHFDKALVNAFKSLAHDGCLQTGSDRGPSADLLIEARS